MACLYSQRRHVANGMVKFADHRVFGKRQLAGLSTRGTMAQFLPDFGQLGSCNAQFQSRLRKGSANI